MHLAYLDISNNKFQVKREYVNFSGLALKFDEQGALEDVLTLQDGDIVGSEPNFAPAEPGIKIDHDKLVIDEAQAKLGLESFLYQGQAFNGLSYEFSSSGILLTEYRMDPCKRLNRSWHYNGRLKQDHQDPSQHIQWHWNGKLKSQRMFHEAELIYRAGYNPAGEIDSLMCGVDLLSTEEHLRHPVSHRLHLFGRGIQDRMLTSWLAGSPSEHLQEITLEQTQVSEQGLATVANANWARLTLTHNEYISKNWAQQFKTDAKACTVIHNNVHLETQSPLRVHGAQITTHEDKCYFENALFSGLLYQFDSTHRLQNIDLVEAGVTVGQSTDIIRAKEKRPRVDSKALHLNETYLQAGAEKYSLDDKDFQGIFYRFDDSGVLREEAYCDPIKAEFRHWNEDGTLRREQTREEYFAWHGNGHLLHHRYRSNKVVEKYHDDGSLYWLTVDDDTDLDLGHCQYVNLAKHVYIQGHGVSDQILHEIFVSQYQAQVEQLYLRSTAAGDAFIKAIEKSVPNATVESRR